MKNTDFEIGSFSGKFNIRNKKTGKLLIPHYFNSFEQAKQVLNFDQIVTLKDIESFNCCSLMAKIVKIQGYNTYVKDGIKYLLIEK